jgi:hypothetical protein
LGVVFDGRTNTAAVSPLARMCERAGIDTVWIADPFAGTALSGDLDAWLMAADLLRTLSTSSVGVMIDSRRGTADLIELVANRMHQGPGGRKRLELNLPDSGGEPRDAQRLRDELSAVGIDDIVLSAWQTPDLETAADEARAAAMDAGRDPASLGVAALVPVSVGRTDAEAAARAGMDPDFTRFGHPAEIGIFGTLEECQDRVIALAHAGITDLRCVLPATPDVHDVIAQLTAISMGTVDVLLPGSLRSPAPPPPEGWGGRPDRPPSRRVSDGSRRRR